MAELKTDRELLREYAESGSEGAFRSLVERHLNLVFATALRGLNDPGAAQEIAQNVFITLARKAVWLGGETSVAAWLHKAALLEVRQWWRGELRRQRREQTAVELGTIMKDENSLLEALAGELDEGLLGLREADRQALLLRYFEGRSHREIGVLLGAREDAVRMRIDKALDRLTRFFRRRGYAVPAVATTTAVLGAAAKAAPAGFAQVAARSALTAGGAGAAGGLKLLLLRTMGLTRTQTVVLCAGLVVAPVTWEWSVNRQALDRASESEGMLAAVREQQQQADADTAQLRAESARLEGALADAGRDRYAEAARKLEALKGRVQGLLTDANYRWPDDLPYVRVPKPVVRALNLLDRSPGTFTPAGTLTEPAQEWFGVTAQEKAPSEQALAKYWRGVEDMMTANAYETNLPGGPPGQLTKTVIIPPLGQPLKDLAADTGTQLVNILGTEREQLLFGGWDQGGIQIFWPGNLWKISDEPQTLNLWAAPAAGNSLIRFGGGWHEGGTGWSGDGQSVVGGMPRGIVTQFFTPWLGQFGISLPNQYFGDPNE